MYKYIFFFMVKGGIVVYTYKILKTDLNLLKSYTWEVILGPAF